MPIEVKYAGFPAMPDEKAVPGIAEVGVEAGKAEGLG